MKALALPLFLLINLNNTGEGGNNQKKSDSNINTEPEKKHFILEGAYEIIPNKYNMPILKGASQNMEKMVVLKADSSTHFHLKIKKENYLSDRESNVLRKGNK